ncbi:MAG: TRL domain-containing protein [Leptospira bouyouniensis]|uniref:TRL-like family protein n=1 Tax=Leptospira bouyouniensis TaxID=2484911 RepID=A0A7I0HUS0_9LEPT|nr:TRL domain-containing protein [Leptospira bouyouniensis]TGL08083.1 TRL-like family protein [Leptospira bouyouniensis]TGM87497.1 TRL-like family protein [Leptospira bouyouniensis]
MKQKLLKHISNVLFGLTIGSFISCANIGQPQGIGPTGLIYASYTLALSERPLPKQTLKQGKACLKRYGFFYVTGDGSIHSAAENAGIQEIFRIEKEATNYLSLYSTLCTVVWGI